MNSSSNQKRIENLFFWSLGLSFSFLFIWLSRNNYISHSEFWSISSAKLLGDDIRSSSFLYIKPLFSFFLASLYMVDLGDIDHILWARSFFGLIAAFISLILARFVFLFTRSYPKTLLFLGLLLSFHVYFYNIYRVRSDILGGLFFYLGLLRMYEEFKSQRPETKFDFALAAYGLLGILCTPKFLYFLILIFFVYGHFFSGIHNLKKSYLRSFMVFLLPSLICGLASLVFFQFLNIDYNPYSIASQYYLNSLTDHFTTSSFRPLIQTIRINFLAIFFTLGLLLVGIFKKRSSLSTEEKAMGVLSLGSGIILLLHPERWDFFIAPLIPLFLLPIVVFLKKFKGRNSLFVLFIFLFLTPPFMTYFKGWHYSNQRQLELIGQLEKILNQYPDTTYFDSTGVLPRHKSLISFFGPNDPRSNRFTLMNIKIEKPEFIFFTAKVKSAMPSVWPLIFEDYYEYQLDFWVRKDFIEQMSFEEDSLKYPISESFLYDRRPRVRF